MASFLNLQGSQGSLEPELANGHHYLAPKTNENMCEICGAALGGEQDLRFCHVCKKVLCVCCSEMQEKLLFMRNDTKKTRGDNCALCDLLRTISGEENSTSVTGGESIIQYQNHGHAKQSILTETESDRVPQVLDKVTPGDSKSDDTFTVNSTVVSANDGSKVGVPNSSETDQDHSKDGLFMLNSDVLSDQRHKIEGKSDKKLDSGRKDGQRTTLAKGQGHLQLTTPEGGQGDQGDKYLDKGQGVKQRTALDRGQGYQERTALDRGQGDQERTALDRGQGDQERIALDRGQGDQERTALDRGQVNKLETKTLNRSKKNGPIVTAVIGDCPQTSILPEMTTQAKKDDRNQTKTDKTAEVNTTKPIVFKQDSSVSDKKEVSDRSSVLLSKDEQNMAGKPDDEHFEKYWDNMEAKTSRKGKNFSSSDRTENTTFEKDETITGKPTQHVQVLKKQNSELDSSVAESSEDLSKLPGPNSTNQLARNFIDDGDDFDDDPEEVEYDNLGLKDYREQQNLLGDVLKEMFVIETSRKDRPPRQPRRPETMKMAVVMLTQPGKVTRQQDEYGRDTLTQQYHYSNILVVETGNPSQLRSEGNSPLALPAVSSPDPSSQESIPHLRQDPHSSYFQSLSKESAKGNHSGVSADRFSEEKPEGYTSGDFSGAQYEHLSKHTNEAFRGVSHQGGSPVGQTGASDTLQNAVSDYYPGQTVAPVYGKESPSRSDPGSSDIDSKVSVVTQKRSKNRHKQAFTHACSGCGRRDCEGNFMKLLREMIVTAGSAGFEIRNVIPDGNCMFAAIVDQMELKKNFSFSPKSLRFECLNFLRDNPESEDGTPYALFLDAETWDEYLSRMSQDGEWGDHMMLQAISQVTKRNIQVIHHDAERDWTVIEYKLDTLDKSDKTDCLFLGHVGEFHYVSLRPSDLAKQLHNKDDPDSDQENYRSMDVFSSLPSLPSIDDPAKQEMFEEDYFDPWSEIPALHLTYILKKFVPLVTTLQSADSVVTNAEMLMEDGNFTRVQKRFGLGSASSVVLTGDAAEGLYAPYLNERERTEFDQGSEWVDVTGIVMPNTCIAYPKDHSDVGMMDAFIETENVHPGYARLLSRYPDQWGMTSSETGVISCYLPSHHSNFKKVFNLSKEEKDYSASQNTSVVSLFNKISLAIVAPFWPAVADEWRTRQRKANWPPQNIIDSIIAGGYHFECFPHPKSQNPDIEFHACFGVAEKMLAQEALSREQRYIFLVFKALCSQEFTEEDLITSAHLKNIFFYACEQLPCDFWVSRPGSCIFYLLDALFTCIQERNVPDFFLPANNLIDHFDEDQHKKILQKIMTLRNDPMSNLLKIGQKNRIYNAHGILSQVTNDIELFHDHHSARRSVLEALVPISINIAKYSVHTGAYKQALEQLQEAYEERLAISTCEDALPFTAFLTQATDGCSVEKQWWFFFNVDQQLHTTLCADLSMAMQPVALEELVGKDVAQTQVGTLIPAVMAHKLCRFCSDMATHLFSNYFTQKCLPFLLFNLNRYREKLQRLMLGKPQGQQQYNPRQPLTSEDEDDFTDENAARVFNQLYIVYNRLNQLWIFQDLIPEFENLCEVINTREAFSKLVTILKQMGLTERAQMAEARRNSIPRETTRSGYLDNGNYY
ncbi:uncharacterized protein LOC110455155 [Mizuhopecten yessoensis]|uniref:Ubiquitin thioesterase n=1 Tax=Mizuhopecten yessoensis TaxID=6573 RepID=A0A210QDJ4_MIZYE|nr:uncharacterized protein LOC110455155 [Mizuhopecten yessoensis]OWF46809.1 Ubiquitin thioesterase [Mizuhopecten yessoensis]